MKQLNSILLASVISIVLLVAINNRNCIIITKHNSVKSQCH